MNRVFKENGVFCLNTLPADAMDLSDLFAGRGKVAMEERFRRGDWVAMETGSPALKSARTAIDCRISQVSEVGTHSVLFGEVARVQLGEPGPALMYIDRAYRSL